MSEFAAKMDKAADAAGSAKRVSMARAAAQSKREMERARNRVVGADGRFSRSRIRFGVGYNLGTTTERETALVFARGPWGMIEGGTKAHPITSRHGGGSRRSRAARATFVGPQFVGRGRNRRLQGRTGGDRRAVLKIPGVGYRRSAMHPGTRGRRAWTRGREKVFRDVPRLLGDPIASAVRDVFR